MKSFEGLSTGDIVKHKLHDDTYVVTANYGNRVTAVRTVDMCNHNEWDLVLKANLEKPEVNKECRNCGWWDRKTMLCMYSSSPEKKHWSGALFTCDNWKEIPKEEDVQECRRCEHLKQSDLDKTFTCPMWPNIKLTHLNGCSMFTRNNYDQYNGPVSSAYAIRTGNNLEFKANLEKPAPEVKEECSNCGWHRPLKPNEKCALGDSKLVRCILPNNQYAEATYKCPMWYLESDKIEVKKECGNCQHWRTTDTTEYKTCNLSTEMDSICTFSSCSCPRWKEKVKKICKNCAFCTVISNEKMNCPVTSSGNINATRACFIQREWR